jgi:hypothetical protein
MLKPGNTKLLIIVWLSLLTGTLDAIAAIIIGYPATPGQIFRYIASGLFGKAAFTGNHMIFWGVLFHYLIATTFSVVFFVLYPNFKRILKNKYVTGILYGFIIWVVMNMAVLPLSNVPKQPGQVNLITVITSLLALIICIGLPVSLTVTKYYRKKRLY